ncbi:uncharacterized protein LOC142517622 isoform X1 [Primulina tabacum]|uniref:uncharacterized protein LOC142517622 isoform X1 n=1 Tax=Primulina tabacum TaxID=48773 RepID=UPI003F5A1C65
MRPIQDQGMVKQLFLCAMLMASNMLSQIEATSSVSGRYLAETGGSESSEQPYDHNTVRADPLDHLRKYRGGYDISNKHYWSSTAFTGIYGYAIAALWILCGVGYGAFLLARATCCKSNRKLKKRSACQNKCYLVPLLWTVVFTILAITGSGLVLGGNAKFHSRAKTIIDIIIDTADDASHTIYNTTRAMKEMTLSLGKVNGSRQATSLLTSTSRRLDSQAADIERQASKHRRDIDKGIKIAYIVTTVAISLSLVTVLALLVSGILKFRRTFRALIILCWFFTVLCWLFFGIYLFLKNFAGDTCTALESFQKDPYNNSLSSIVPCDELLSAKPLLSDVSAGIYNLVKEVNKNLSTDYGNIVQICNPFSPPPNYEYQPWSCPADSIRIGDISQVLRTLACPDSNGETCKGGILVPANYFHTVEAYSTSIQKLLDVYPGMESLVECQTVKDAFAKILRQHCHPLKRYVRMVWVSSLFLSVVMVVLILVWIIGSHHDDRNLHSLKGSVKPHDHKEDVVLESNSSWKA